MIDCENEVFTRVATAIREKYPEVNIASEFVSAPSAFPHVSIVMADNPDSLNMTMTDPMFEVNVYSNKTEGKKSEAKGIMAIIRSQMASMNFRCSALTPTPNLEDATIYRLTGRFEVRTDGQHFYRR